MSTVNSVMQINRLDLFHGEAWGLLSTHQVTLHKPTLRWKELTRRQDVFYSPFPQRIESIGCRSSHGLSKARTPCIILLCTSFQRIGLSATSVPVEHDSRTRGSICTCRRWTVSAERASVGENTSSDPDKDTEHHST